MVAQRQPTIFTEHEYLALEAVAATRHEFVAGMILAMAGAEFSHNRVAANALVALAQSIGDGPCIAVGSDQRLKVEATGEYFYPDVTVVCGEPTLVVPAPRSLTNPTIIVEVLSPSTASYDAGEKLEAYLRIPTLGDYVLVATDRRHVTHYHRRDADDWGVRSHSTGAVILAHGIELAIDALYHRVDGV